MNRSQQKLLACLSLSVLFVVLVGGLLYQAEAAETTSPTLALPTGTTPTGNAGSSVGTGTPDDYVIQTDDILTIDGNQHSTYLDPRRRYRVATDGTIKVIFLKERVQAAGLTVRELEQNLEELYDPKFFKNLTINIDVASKTFSIGGEVRVPGIKNFLMETTLLEAISLAGWFTDYAKVGKVIILRNEKDKAARYEIDCDDILKGKTEDFVIKPNDKIFVPPKGIF